jgi:hypothetical protein
MDETLVQVAGRWRQLFRAVDRSAQPLIPIGRKGGIAKLPNLSETSAGESRSPAAGRFRAGWVTQRFGGDP